MQHIKRWEFVTKKKKEREKYQKNFVETKKSKIKENKSKYCVNKKVCKGGGYGHTAFDILNRNNIVAIIQ